MSNMKIFFAGRDDAFVGSKKMEINGKQISSLEELVSELNKSTDQFVTLYEPSRFETMVVNKNLISNILVR